MYKKIEHPKVFISYSWSSKEYQEKVMNLAERLQNDGIEVIIDKWIMQPGNDTLNFMEKCVKDDTVNFVLMLLDKVYAEKADKRTGGVGIETQIISNEVYNNVGQNKFIPIVFERDETGKVSKPTYLQTRFYYDLTQDNFEEEYVKLVKQIYGREIYYKLKLGSKPVWVEESLNSPSSLNLKILNQKEKYRALEKEIYDALLNDEIVNKSEGNDKSKNVLQVYSNYIKYRNVLLEIFLKDYDSKDLVDNICDFYENIKQWNKNNNEIKKEIWDAFIHETFIYLIAVLFKFKNYTAINILINKSCFQDGYYKNIINSNYYFYSNNYNSISSSKCKLDDKVYYSGMAQLWIENIYEPKINKDEFTMADLLIYNLSILLLDEQRWYWFPITYVYASNPNFNHSLRGFSIKLKSKYELEKIQKLFSTSSVEKIKLLFESMKLYMENNKDRVRYLKSFDTAEIITDFIKVDEIGSVK